MKENSSEQIWDIKTDIFSILDSTVHLPETRRVGGTIDRNLCMKYVCICVHTLIIASVQLFVFVLNNNNFLYR